MLSTKRKPEIEVEKDGRLILRGRAYHQMRVKLCGLAEEKCENEGCGRRTVLEDGEAHHTNGRGGGKRDDRIIIEGKRNLFWFCKPCHRGEHVPAKVVPAKPTDKEFTEMLGL
jgi:hypothetical protein